MSLSEDQIAEIRAKFTELDVNGDGFISKDELKALFVNQDASLTE